MQVVSFGECMLELQGEPFGLMRQGFGGDTLNTAIYLARCGARRGLRVHYATALGDDSLSSGLMQRWSEESIGLDFVRRLPGRMPGLYLIEVDPRGERRFSYWRGEAAARAYFDTEPDATPLEARLAEIDALYFSGISLAILPAAGRERLWQAAQRLRARGGLVVFDNNYRPRLWPDAAQARAAFDRSLALASIALLTLDDEIALRPDGDAAAALEAALAAPSGEVVIKRGAGATLVRTGGTAPVEVAALEVPHVVDTTAAGDSFAGAYLAARLAGRSAVEAAHAGNRLAARVVQFRGALINRADMADLME